MESEGRPKFTRKIDRQRSPEYIKTLTELERVIELPKEEQIKYIEKRLTSLAEKAETGEISHAFNAIHKGFLGPETYIRPNVMVEPLVMDDPSLYATFLETLGEIRKHEIGKDKSLRQIMMSAIQWTLTKYFGNIATSQESTRQNRGIYYSRDADEGPISIKEFKGKGISFCPEKAAAAQNLMAFAGMESELIASANCRFPAEAEKEVGHFFILLHSPKVDMIYDPTKPTATFDKNGALIDYGPAGYAISEEQSQRLLSGGSVTVEHLDERIDENGQKVPVKSNRLYAGPKHYGKVE